MSRKTSDETRQKLREAALQRVQKPRKKRSNRQKAGWCYAERWLPLPDLCERCKRVPPRDRHHIDGNAQNNDRGNVQFLCRRCHQTIDGRIQVLRENGYRSPPGPKPSSLKRAVDAAQLRNTGMSQRQIAFALGISQARVSQLLSLLS